MISDENKNKLLEELRKTYLVTNACNKTGISRSTFYRWCKEDLEFKTEAENAKLEGLDLMNDAGESVLIHGIKNKDRKSAEYFLAHNHPKYMIKTFHDRHEKESKLRLHGPIYSILEMMGAIKLWHKLFGDRPFPSESEIEAMEEPFTPPSDS